MTSGSDTQDAAEGASEIGGIATYDQNCRFSGTPIAILDDFAVGSGTAARPVGLLAGSNMGGSGGMVAGIRLLSGSEELSEVAYGADFTGDGFRDDVIPAPANATPANSRRVGFYHTGVAIPNANLDNASNIAIAHDDWNRLGLATGANVAQNDRDVQIFVNRASDCWDFRRV